jgi:hypothetical protein
MTSTGSGSDSRSCIRHFVPYFSNRLHADQFVPSSSQALTLAALPLSKRHRSCVIEDGPSVSLAFLRFMTQGQLERVAFVSLLLACTMALANVMAHTSSAK